MLNNIFKDIADAIREKKGITDKINPIDFSNEIKSISGGGGGDITYYKVNNEYVKYGTNIIMLILYTKLIGLFNSISDDGLLSLEIVPTGALALYASDMENALNNIKIIAFSPIKTRFLSTNQQWGDYMEINSIYDFGGLLGISKEDIEKGFIEITEEEFYNFNPNEQ